MSQAGALAQQAKSMREGPLLRWVRSGNAQLRRVAHAELDRRGAFMFERGRSRKIGGDL